MTTIGLAGTGEMGAAVAQRIGEFGGLVLSCLEERGEASCNRARAAGVENASERSILERCEVYLSIAPSAVAEQIADRFLAVAATIAKVPVFIDCNAIAPTMLKRISARFHAAGFRFGDGAIVGGPPRSGDAGPRIYLSGPVSDEAAHLRNVGLDTRYLSAMAGDASALKLAYAGLTKGLQALAAGVLIGADDAEVIDPLVDEVRQSLPGIYEFLTKSLPKMPRKAGRWEQEMREIAIFLDASPGAAAMLVGAADQYREIAVAHGEPSSSLSALIDRFVVASRKT